MKHLIITSALIGSGLISFAQGNRADIQQNGHHNTHTVQQTGTGEKLMLVQGTASETSIMSNAEVRMDGTMNEVLIQQLGGPNNEATVATEGANGLINVRQDGSDQRTTVEQAAPFGTSGSDVISIVQEGNINDAEVFQGKDGASMRNETILTQQGQRNEAEILQGVEGEGRAEDNIASIAQIGSDNSSRIGQGYARSGGGGGGVFNPFGPSSLAKNNHGTVRQEGNRNRGNIFQGSFSGIAEANTATLSQTGNDNIANVSQGTFDKVSERNVVTVVQTEDANNAMIKQGSFNGTATNNTIALTQRASGFASVDQGGSNGTVERNEVMLTQFGDSRLSVNQGGNGSIAVENTVVIAQVGDAHQADVNQGGGIFGGTIRRSEVRLTQQGHTHEADVYQGIEGGLGEENVADLTQTGNRHRATIYQGAGSVRFEASDGVVVSARAIAENETRRSTTTITQHGNEHYAVTLQAGANHSLTLQQSGMGNVSQAAQGVTLPTP